MSEARMIKTGLTEQKYADIIESVRGQLSDGMWENSKKMESYWRFFDFDIDNNEIVLRISTEPYYHYKNLWFNNGFVNMSDKEVKVWIATKLKQIVKEEYPKAGDWNRLSTSVCDYLTRDYKNNPITIADAYWVYDRLKERKVYVA